MMSCGAGLSSAASKSPVPVRYGAGAILFHWAMAILIALLGIQGFLIDSTPRASHNWWINLHVAVGTLLAVLLIGRIGWRATHRPPDLPLDTSPLVRISAHFVHMLLYVTILFVVIVGFVNFFSRGHGIDFGLFQTPPLMAADRALTRPFDRLHTYSSYFLLALAGAHMMAALWHHFIAGATILLRMLPDRR